MVLSSCMQMVTEPGLRFLLRLVKKLLLWSLKALPTCFVLCFVRTIILNRVQRLLLGAKKQPPWGLWTQKWWHSYLGIDGILDNYSGISEETSWKTVPCLRGCTGQMKQPLGSSASTKFSLTPPMSYLPQDPGPGILAPGTTFHHVRGQQQNQLTQKALSKLPLFAVLLNSSILYMLILGLIPVPFQNRICPALVVLFLTITLHSFPILKHDTVLSKE